MAKTGPDGPWSGCSSSLVAPPIPHQAESANGARSRLLANMSHELRTPLNAIIGFSDALRSEAIIPVEARVKSYCDDIYHAGQQLLAVVTDILEIAEIEAGHGQVPAEAIDVAELVKLCFAMMSAPTGSSGMALPHDGSDGAPPISTDRTRLMGAMVNLLGHAVRITPPGGSVTVTVTTTPDALHLSVSDIGTRAAHRGRYGYRWIMTLLRNAGWSVHPQRGAGEWRRKGGAGPAGHAKPPRLQAQRWFGHMDAAGAPAPHLVFRLRR